MHRARTAHKRVPHTCIAHYLEITVDTIGNVGYVEATNYWQYSYIYLKYTICLCQVAYCILYFLLRIFVCSCRSSCHLLNLRVVLCVRIDDNNYDDDDDSSSSSSSSSSSI